VSSGWTFNVTTVAVDTSALPGAQAVASPFAQVAQFMMTLCASVAGALSADQVILWAIERIGLVLIGARKDGDPWTFGDGVSRGLSNDDMKALNLRMRVHVGACLAVYTGVATGIGVGQVTSTAQIDAAFARIDALVLAGAPA